MAMGRPKRVSDEQIKAMARRVFLEKGPSVAVGVIARRLKVSPASLFHRVKTKERLLVASLWPPDPPELAIMAAGLRPDTPLRTQLTAILQGLDSYLAIAVPASFMLFAGGVPTGVTKKRRGAPAMVRIRTLLAAWLESANGHHKLDALHCQTAAEAMIGALEGRNMHVYLGGMKSSLPARRRFIGELVELFA
jgi:AcrR family transcriptional regulator